LIGKKKSLENFSPQKVKTPAEIFSLILFNKRNFSALNRFILLQKRGRLKPLDKSRRLLHFPGSNFLHGVEPH